MKLVKNTNMLLACCVLVLVVLCWLSVQAPLKFDREQEKRELAVKSRLLKIRVAEEHYCAKHGVYADDLKVLVKDGLLADSLRFIPFSDGKPFDLSTTTTIGKSGKQIPLMECGATYEQYLKGLDENSVANLIEEANNAGRYPGLKIGDITEPNGNAGNWE
jgi:hypothetical protein